MNPGLRADGSGFLGSIVPRSAPVTARFGDAGAAQASTCVSNTSLSCNGTVHRYGPPAAAGGILHRELTGVVELGVSDPESRGGKAPRPIRSSRTLHQASLALPAHGLDREQHLATIRLQSRAEPLSSSRIARAGMDEIKRGSRRWSGIDRAAAFRPCTNRNALRSAAR